MNNRSTSITPFEPYPHPLMMKKALDIGSFLSDVVNKIGIGASTVGDFLYDTGKKIYLGGKYVLDNGLSPDSIISGLTGLGQNEAKRDALRFFLLAMSVPVGLAAIRELLTYSDPKILSSNGISSNPYAITKEDYYEALRREYGEQKRQKKANYTPNPPSVLEKALNVIARYPIASVGILLTPMIIGPLANRFISKEITKPFLERKIHDDKIRYLQELRRSVLLSKKVMRGELTEEDIANLPPEVKSEIEERLTRRLGSDFDLDNSETKTGSFTKKGIGIISLPVTFVRALFAIPFIRYGLSAASAANQAPLWTSISETEKQLREWQAKTYPYEVESSIESAPVGFFDEDIEAALGRFSGSSKKKPKSKSESDKELTVINRYLKERMQALKEQSSQEDLRKDVSGVKETKVRGTKIVTS